MSGSYTIWVCDNCMLHYANGECGDCHSDGGHDETPWGLWQCSTWQVTMGMLSFRHQCTDCEPLQEIDRDCDCEWQEHFTSPCSGCNTYTHGRRSAFTVWED